MSNDAKVPSFKIHDEGGAKPIEPDWGMIYSNQISMLTNTASMIDNQKQMLIALERIAESEIHETMRQQRQTIIEQQANMNKSIDNLVVHIDQAREELELAVTKLSSSIMSILQIPITVTVIAGASWLFYLKYIEEWTWIAIIAVASFRYLGDSITGVAKLFGFIRHGNNKQ